MRLERVPQSGKPPSCSRSRRCSEGGLTWVERGSRRPARPHDDFASRAAQRTAGPASGWGGGGRTSSLLLLPWAACPVQLLGRDSAGPGCAEGGPQWSPDRSHVALLQGDVPEAQVEREAGRRPSNVLSLWLTLICFLRASQGALAALRASLASTSRKSSASACSAAEP